MQTTANCTDFRLRDIRPTTRWIAVCGLALSTGLACVASARAETPDERASYHRIGPTATVTEVSSGLPFSARVDTGATSCSIHCEAFEIEDPSDDPAKNIGKPVRLLVKNNEGESEWIKSTIADHVTVKSAARADERYKVPLYFRWGEVEKKVLVTINDRQHMTYPVLLGRNFLKGDFLVDVSLEPKE